MDLVISQVACKLHYFHTDRRANELDVYYKSGKRRDHRPAGEVAQAEELVASGQIDLVILEDLGRYLRRLAAVVFCENCEDMATRLIAINDIA